jgi:hypothetical protein
MSQGSTAPKSNWILFHHTYPDTAINPYAGCVSAYGKVNTWKEVEHNNHLSM